MRASRSSASTSGRAYDAICPTRQRPRQNSNRTSSRLGALTDALDVALRLTVIPDTPMRVLNVSSRPELDLLLEKGVLDVLSVVSDAPVQGANCSPLGNDEAPRTWVGDVESVPPYMGPFSVAIIDRDTLGDGLRGALLKASLMLRPGGHLVVYCSQNCAIDVASINALIHDLCLEVVDAKDIGEDAVILRVPENFALPRRSSSIRMNGEVVTGYGRGSKNLGVPTANLRPADVASQIDGLPLGVYFGFARLVDSQDDTVRKMVMNIGKRPTFVADNGPEESIEVHVLDYDGGDFYGERLSVVVCGYLRPEMRFNGLDALLNRIQTDIGMARSQLDCDRWATLKADI